MWKGARRAASRSRGAVRTIACSEMPVVEQSKFASVTRSFIASVIFLSIPPSVIRASNMVKSGCWCVRKWTAPRERVGGEKSESWCAGWEEEARSPRARKCNKNDMPVL